MVFLRQRRSIKLKEAYTKYMPFSFFWNIRYIYIYIYILGVVVMSRLSAQLCSNKIVHINKPYGLLIYLMNIFNILKM